MEGGGGVPCDERCSTCVKSVSTLAAIATSANKLGYLATFRLAFANALYGDATPNGLAAPDSETSVNPVAVYQSEIQAQRSAS